VVDPGAGPLVADACAAVRRGEHLRAHRALARHLESRPRRWPIAAGRRDALTREIQDRFPAAAIDVRDRADRLLEGRYDLLGYRDLQLGNPPDWHADAAHGRRAPRGYWAAIPFLDRACGDHKVIWEANRHQHFLTLGTAYWLTGRRRYRDAFIGHLEHWLAENPPLDGINWASMLELGLRALSWTWAVEFFAAGAAADEVPWLVDLVVALDRQLDHIGHNLSTYFSPNTHISGEALALYAVSRAFPELAASGARAAAGRRILLREAAAQVRADGGHVEQSSHYHRYSTDFYLLAHVVAALTADTDAFAGVLGAQARYLRTIADERGHLPQVGDEDGGRLFPFGAAAPPSDASATLAAAASVLDDPALAVAPPGPEVYWILGAAPRAVAPRPPVPWPSRVLPDSGYVVLRREGGDHLLFDAGPHGFLNGGHAHADALSIVLTVAGEPLLVDPGTATYTMDAAVRDRFRGPEMHTTVTIDGEPFARPRGPFHWQHAAGARLLAARVDGAAGFAAGSHSGYGFPVFRLVTTVAGRGWLVVDYVAPPRPARVDAHWHLHPAWTAEPEAAGFRLTHASGTRLGIATTAVARDLVRGGVFSPVYGRIERATVLRTSEDASGPAVVGTYVPARLPDGAVPALTAAALARGDHGWTICTFAIADACETRVTVALPGPGLAEPPRDWPQPCIQERRAVCVE
jgi:hypothetical protein